MIKISNLADYATRIMHFLYQRKAQRFSASVVAEQLSMPQPTVSKLLKLLAEANLLDSTRGVNGGYQLACEPENMNLAQIICAIDGQLAVTECAKETDNCQHTDGCELRSNWQFINRMIHDFLARITLADMANPHFCCKEIPIQFYERRDTTQ